MDSPLKTRNNGRYPPFKTSWIRPYTCNLEVGGGWGVKTLVTRGGGAPSNPPNNAQRDNLFTSKTIQHANILYLYIEKISFSLKLFYSLASNCRLFGPP